MSPKVSIIVPIYNAGKFLEKCLDTLTQQTLKDIEIILVLDCPTDGSDLVAREYAEKDPRIKLIVNEHNLNIGLSRNEGLKIARGEYIGFSDHDDWRELDMYENMYHKAIKSQADIVISSYDKHFPDKIIPHATYPPKTDDNQFKEKIFAHCIGKNTEDKLWEPFTLNGYMWHMLYKRELIEKNKIFFLDNKQATFEDLFFLIQIFYYAKKIIYLPVIYYHHIYHNSNGANSYSYYSIPLVIGYIEKVRIFLEEKRLMHKYAPEFFFTILFYLKNAILNEIKFKSYKSVWQQFKNIRAHKPIIEILRKEKITFHTIKKLKLQKTLLWLLLRF